MPAHARRRSSSAAAAIGAHEAELCTRIGVGDRGTDQLGEIG
jgi:hypothetical protein